MENLKDNLKDNLEDNLEDKIADRLKNIKESPTLALTKKVSELRASGKEITDFGVGEPSFETPDHVCQAGMKAIHDGKTKYTPVDGTLSLRKAISDKLKKENNLNYQTNEIIAGTGAKQVIFNAMLATVNPGDEVIIPAPYWVSYPDMVQLAEGIPVVVRCDESTQFKMTAAQLEKAISPKTKWLILNSPSNPTGMVYSEEELRGLVEVLRKYPQVLILSDDIYEHLIYDELNFINILNIAPDLKSRTLIVNGVSKSHAMTGWRLGYGAGNATLIKNISKIQSHSTSNPSSISQYAAEGALVQPMDFFSEWKEKYISRRDLAMKILSESGLLKIIKPQGAFYLFINCARAIGKTGQNGAKISNDSQVADYLLEVAKVGVVPGVAFGLSPYFRLSYVAEDQIVQEGCERIVQALNSLQ